MLKFVPDHLKTKKQSHLLRNVSVKYKTQQMCDKAILENVWMLYDSRSA